MCCGCAKVPSENDTKERIRNISHGRCSLVFFMFRTRKIKKKMSKIGMEMPSSCGLKSCPRGKIRRSKLNASCVNAIVLSEQEMNESLFQKRR